jgi:ribosomal subunit interface protein
MKWQFNFRHVDVSQSLREYTQEQFEKLSPYLLKDSRWQVNYTMGKYDYQVEVVVTNPDGRFKATASCTDSFYVAVDEAADKLGKQFVKLKEKMQDHKKFDRSKQGKMKRVNRMLEYDNSPYPNKKPA